MEVIVKWVLEDTPLEGIPFDEEHFPDANFRANLARNMMAETADLWLTPEELTGEHAKDLILNFAEYKDMESMEGIQYFTALEYVNFIGTKVKSVDFSQNTKLKSVSGWFSGLMSLDLSNNTALTSAELDPQHVYNWPVNKITVNGKDYYYIGLAKFAAQVKAYEGEMRETYVPFNMNRVTWGANCELFDEEVPSEGGVLSEGLSAETFNHIPVLLIDPEKTSFTYYYDVNNQVESDGKMEVIVKWVLSDPLDGIPFDEEHFPDANFRRALASEFPDETADLFWTYAELATVSEIDCMNKSIVSMKGIEYFTELTNLRCYNNALGQDDQPLDLSSNVALQSLVGWNNYDLKQIILPETESLTTIHVSECALTSIDVTKNPNLESLKCTNNELTWLDLTQNPALRTLLCRGNHLTSLDLSQNTELKSYQGGGQTVDLGVCDGYDNNGMDYFFYGLQETYSGRFTSLPEEIHKLEVGATESFIEFSLNRVTWGDGCEVIEHKGGNGNGAPRRIVAEYNEDDCPILHLTAPDAQKFTYDYDVNSPNNLSAMDVSVNYTKPIITAIDTVTADANVVSVRYINVSGVSSNKPWDGVNIVVTTKADGTQSVTKVLR